MAHHIDERRFTEFVADQIRHGSNLVPFVGSGISAPSGIVMGQDFMNYLTWVVYRSVAELADQRGEFRLDLRKEGWPELPDATQVEAARDWVGGLFKKICEHHGVDVTLNDDSGFVESLTPQPGSDFSESRLRRPLVPKILWTLAIEKEDSDLRSLLWSRSLPWSLKWDEVSGTYSAPPEVSTTSESYISECAIRNLHDWRCTLDFLARLHMGHVPSGLALWLEKVDQTIIDSFNFFITDGRKPNLAHNMLCHLASRARIRNILTTNFDTLLEDAFSQLGEHFEVIPVGIHGELPAPETVLAQNSILKLHGSLADTRADLSLDERPKDRDLERFSEYVAGKPANSKSVGFLPGLLLVCGYSGNDLRCVQMIKYLLNTDKESKVLWVSHNEEGLKRIGQIFGDYEFAERSGVNLNKARIVATITDRTDLLFYELYQRLTLSLPRGGFNYQFSPNVPPRQHLDCNTVDESEADREQGTGNTKSKAPLDPSVNLLWKRLQTQARSKVMVVDGPAGLMEPMTGLFDWMTREEHKNGIWLELEDYADTASLAHELFTIIALRLGRFQLDHARLMPPLAPPERQVEIWKRHITDLIEHWAIAPVDWFIVLYGRNGPGGCAGWEETYWRANGQGNQYNEFETFLNALRDPGPRGQGFMILYAPYAEARSIQDKKRQLALEKVTSALRKRQRQLKLVPTEWAKFDEWENHINRDHGDLLSKRAFRYRVWDQTAGFSIIPLHDYAKNAALFDPPEDDLRVDTEKRPDGPFQNHLNAISKKWLENPDNPLPARRALYAATLFRQARHFSAFLSEGVYPCPCRFNTIAIDNDWLRNHDVSGWLEAWNDLPDTYPAGGTDERSMRSIFLRKPGGFAWAYRDSRLGIQRMIEGMGPVEFSPGHWKSHATEARARTHFWIAEWHGRAYRATGHADPLLEAIYHYAECIYFCRIAMPLASTLEREPAHSYRLRYARRALLQLTKTLRLGRRDLRFWIQRAAGEPWFGKTAIKRLITGFRSAFDKLNPAFNDNSQDLEEWLSDLRWEMFTLPQQTEDEMRELRFAGNIGGATLLAASRYPSPSVSAFSPNSLLDDKTWREQLSKEWATNLCALPEEAPLQESSPLPEISARFSALMKALDAERENKEFSQVLDTNLKTWRDKTLQAYDPQRLFVLTQVTFELAYWFVMRAKRKHHHLQADEQPILNVKLARLWVQVCGLCWLTLDLCDELSATLLTKEISLRIAACTLYGLALGRLGRFYEAHRRLNEAHAWLSKSEDRSEPPDEALIKLRRAEVHIFEALRLRCILVRLEAELKEQVKQKRSKQLVVTRDWRLILQDGKIKHDVRVLDQWGEMYLGEENGRPPASVGDVLNRFLKIHIAKLDDAWLASETAERVLSGKSHSSLWWGHLHQLRLRIYATHWIPRADSQRDLPVALVFRKRRDHLAAVRKTYQAGWVASRADPYHAIRLVDYGCQAVDQLTKLKWANPKDACCFVRERLKKHFESIDQRGLKGTLLFKYRKRVSNRITKFLRKCEDENAPAPPSP